MLISPEEPWNKIINKVTCMSFIRREFFFSAPALGLWHEQSYVPLLSSTRSEFHFDRHKIIEWALGGLLHSHASVSTYKLGNLMYLMCHIEGILTTKYSLLILFFYPFFSPYRTACKHNHVDRFLLPPKRSPNNNCSAFVVLLLFF